MLKTIITIIFLCLFIPQKAYANEPKQITIINPIRGGDFWQFDHSILDTPRKQYEIIHKNNFPATWLIRYDGFKDFSVASFLKSLDSDQEVGLFLEITPSLTNDANVNYNLSENWHNPESIFTTGYTQEDRKKILDRAFSKFKEAFGYFPKSVGAWWIDSYSLNYLKEKYDIVANLSVADQYSTDQYQIWGQYFSLPFYPSKTNALVPAGSLDKKLGIVTLQWATRDPFNGYGKGMFESTYSVQANDYILHDLNLEYFKKLVSFYPQVTVGLENDFGFDKYGGEFTKQLDFLKDQRDKGFLQLKTLSSFANYYFSKNPDISPSELIIADNPLGEGKVVWYQTPRYRINWIYNQKGSYIRDLREYNDSSFEPCFMGPCKDLNLSSSFVHTIDEVSLNNAWLIDTGKITDVNIKQNYFDIEISYKNQSGNIRTIKFLKNDIEVNGKVNTISGTILNASKEAGLIEEANRDKSNDLDLSLNHNFFDTFFNFLKFGLLVILFFIIPGYSILKNFLLSLPLGAIMFTVSAYILGYLNHDYLIWVLPMIFIAWQNKHLVSEIKKLPAIRISKTDFLVSLLIVIFSSFWVVTTFKSGLLYKYGYGFWGPNGHDGIWHLSLINELQKNIPPNNPVFAGEDLENYHYFYDLLLAKSGSVLNINTLDLFFRFFPILISLTLGFLVYKFTVLLCQDLNISNKLITLAGFFSIFFLYFGGSFGWVVSFFKNKSFGGESMFWSQQSISTLLNPPFAFSLLLLFSFLILLEKYLSLTPDISVNDLRKIFILRGERTLFIKKINFKTLLCLIVLAGSLIEFKAYGGVLMLGALCLYTIERVLKNDFRLLLIFVGSLALSLLVFLPNNSSSSNLLILSPLWLVKSMIFSADRLNWQRLSLAIESQVSYKIVLGYLIGIAIFLIGNFGTRVVSLLALKKLFENRILFLITFLGILFPIFFIQKGNSWNIIQFLYYSLAILNIFAGISLVLLWQKLPKIVSAVITLVILLLTIPTTIDALNQYLPNRPPAKLSLEEIEALEFLKKQDKGVVINFPHDSLIQRQFSAPVPLYAYTSTSYISAFSGKQSYLEDTINLEILGIDYQGRLNQQRDLLKANMPLKNFLIANNISYIYAVKKYNFRIDEQNMRIKRVFENNEVEIFKVLSPNDSQSK